MVDSFIFLKCSKIAAETSSPLCQYQWNHRIEVLPMILLVEISRIPRRSLATAERRETERAFKSRCLREGENVSKERLAAVAMKSRALTCLATSLRLNFSPGWATTRVESKAATMSSEMATILNNGDFNERIWKNIPADRDHGVGVKDDLRYRRIFQSCASVIYCGW